MIDKIIKSKRRTFSLEVSADGVIVRAPKRATKRDIDCFLRQHHDWLMKKIEKLEAHAERYRAYQYCNGENFYYLGSKIPLHWTDEITRSARFNHQIELPVNYQDRAFEMLEKAYIRQARKILLARLNEFSDKMNLEFNRMGITRAVRRWGSCSSERNINFSYRLIMAPQDVIDYVVVHELAHLKEMNHSRRFWSLVELYSPNYKLHVQWLKRNSEKLSLKRWEVDDELLVNEV